MMERDIQAAVRLALGSDPGIVLWRNTAGFDERAKSRYGLAPGAADLIGICDGRFFALELKRSKGGRSSAEQMRFADLVRRKKGFCCFVRSVEEALAAVDRCRRGLSE